MSPVLRHLAVDAVVFNAVGAMDATDRRGLGRQCLRRAAGKGDLLLGVECDDLRETDLREILGAGWWWRHAEAKHRDGTLLAGRLEVTEPVGRSRYVPGAPASPVNAVREIQLQQVRVLGRGIAQPWRITAAAKHDPRPDHGGENANRAMVTNTRQLHGRRLLVGCDGNRRHAEMVDRFPEPRWEVRSTEVMHVIGGPGLDLSELAPYDQVQGTRSDDHPGGVTSVRPHLPKGPRR